MSPEIRLQIYGYVLGNMTIHFQEGMNPLKHCLGPGSTTALLETEDREKSKPMEKTDHDIRDSLGR